MIGIERQPSNPRVVQVSPSAGDVVVEGAAKTLDPRDDAFRGYARKAEPCERIEAIAKGMPRRKENSAINGSFEDCNERSRRRPRGDRWRKIKEKVGRAFG